MTSRLRSPSRLTTLGRACRCYTLVAGAKVGRCSRAIFPLAISRSANGSSSQALRTSGAVRKYFMSPRARWPFVYLGRANGAVVSRNEILDAVWPRLTVTPDALARCLVELRKAFDDGSDEPRLIETIPKIGIRLTQPVLPAEVSGAFESANPSRRGFLSRRRAWAAGGALAAVLLAAGVASWLGRERADAPPTGNAKALEYYLSANDYARRTNRLEALKSQESLYQRAIEEDPNFALAWVQLGRTHTSFFWYGLDRSSQRLTLAEQAFRHALELRPGLPEAHLYLADYDFKGRGDATAALAEFAIAERSMTRNPDFYFLRSSVYRRTGQWLLAARDGDSAIALDPRNIIYRRQQHITYAFVRDYARAAQVLDGIFPFGRTTPLPMSTRPCLPYPDAATPNRRISTSTPRPRPNIVTGSRRRTRAGWRPSSIATMRGRSPCSTRQPKVRFSMVTCAIRPCRKPHCMLALTCSSGRSSGARSSLPPWHAGPSRISPESTPQIPSRSRRSISRSPRRASNRARSRRASNPCARPDACCRRAPTRCRGRQPSSPRSFVLLVPAHEKDEALRELDDYLSGPGHWAVEGLAADPRLDPLRDDPRFAALSQKYGARSR